MENKTYTKKDYDNYMLIVNTKIEDTKNRISTLNNDEWVARLTYEQWLKFQNGDLKIGDPLDVSDIIRSRDFRYYFNVGEIVKLDFTVMTKEQKEFYKDLEGMHAVITKCWSDLHAFCCGSSYQHELRFENGVESPRKPLMYSSLTFEPIGQVSSYMIIGVSEDEKKYYKKEFENRTPNQKLWWYVTPNSWLNDK